MRSLLLVILTLFVALQGKAQSSIHPKILLDADWRFYRGAYGAGAASPPPGPQISNWRWTADDKGMQDRQAMIDPALNDATAPWQEAKIGDDVFKGHVGFAWFRTKLPAFAGSSPSLHFEAVDDNADVFLNGKFLVHHEGWDDMFDVPLASAWSKTGANTVAILVENTNGPGGITGKSWLSSGPSASSMLPSMEKFADQNWRRVHLPHDYVVEGRFSADADNSHGSLPKPPAWYRKTFRVPDVAKGLNLTLQFDGVYRNSMVWINGHFLGTHPSGYTEFRYDITDFVHFGQPNVISVYVNPAHNEGWWYEGGGIYRHVWLDFSGRVTIAPNGIFATTRMEEPHDGKPVDQAQVIIRTGVISRIGKPVAVQIDSKIFDENGTQVASGHTLENVPDSSGQPTVLNIPNPKLWSIEHPHLYRLQSELAVDGIVVDHRITMFGVRTVRFDPEKGFFLNGKPVKIQGVCNHQDFAGLGIAVPDSMEYWRVQKLKEMGCNAWRMSHNPPTPALLDACDRLGMLVMDENRNLGDTPEILGELASMVQRDRNHPSIIMWSMCNEEPAAGGAKGGQIFKSMMKTVLQFDSTRPVTSAMNSGWFGDGFTGIEDLMGVNYNYEVYDQFHAKYPQIPLFGSETASTVTTRGEYADDKAKTYVSSYNMTDDSWKPAAERPFVAGTFVWTGFDYKGEPSPYGWPCINSHFGIMDMCGFPKDSYYYYQSWWKSKPVVHIMPHWNWPGMEGKEVKVIVFSNAPKVELLLNGNTLGTQTMPRNGHLEWSVPYAPGQLTARGLDTNDSVIASDQVATVGAPASLKLTAIRSRLLGNGEDMEVVAVEILDAKGRVCPTADNLVNFTVAGTGYIAGVGNGNPSDHDPDKARFRHAFNGRCIVIVGTGEKIGNFKLTAASKGLTGASLSFEAVTK